MPRDGLRGVIWWWMGGIRRDRFEGIQQSHIIAFLLKVCRNLWRFFCVWDERIKMIKGVWARDLYK